MDSSIATLFANGSMISLIPDIVVELGFTDVLPADLAVDLQLIVLGLRLLLDRYGLLLLLAVEPRDLFYLLLA